MSSQTHLPAIRRPARTIAAQEVSDGIYAYVQPDGSLWINTTGFLVGRAAWSASTPASTEARTRDYLAAIAEVTNEPIRTPYQHPPPRDLGADTIVPRRPYRSPRSPRRRFAVEVGRRL